MLTLYTCIYMIFPYGLYKYLITSTWSSCRLIKVPNSILNYTSGIQYNTYNTIHVFATFDLEWNFQTIQILNIL